MAEPDTEPENRPEDTEAKLANMTGLREDVIRACNFSEEKLTELYNKASDAAHYSRIATYGLCGAAGGWMTGLLFVQQSNIQLGAAAVMIAGFVTYMWAARKESHNKIDREVRQAANDRLVELDAKDRGQTPAP